VAVTSSFTAQTSAFLIHRPMSERRALLFVTLALTLLSGLPYAYAYAIAPADRQFMGIVSNIQDWSQYLAWMRWFERGLVIINPLTPEQQQPLFFNAQWWLLAQWTRWTAMRPDLTIQIFRVVCALAFVPVTFAFCARYFQSDRLARWTCFLTIQAVAGFGWLLVAYKQLTRAHDVLFPLSVYVAEPISFQNMVIYPHLLLATILIVGALMAFARALERNSVALAALAGLIALVLGLTHAYDLLIVYSVLGLTAVCVVWSRRGQRDWLFPIAALLILLVISVAPPAYFFRLTSGDPVWSVVLRQYKDAGVFTPNPLLLLVLLGTPMLAAWAALALRTPPSAHAPPVWRVLVRVWFVVNFFLNYIPTDFQIKMLTGWQIPLCIIAVEFALDALPGLLKQLRPAFDLARLRVGLAGLLVVSCLPHNAYLLIWRMLEIRRVEHAHFLYRDDLGAMRWLSDNAQPNDVVMAGVTVGQYVPGFAGTQAYVAHWAQTVDFVKRRAAVSEFFAAATSDERRRAIVAADCVRFVFHGREERALGAFDPARAGWLERAWMEGPVAVYRVTGAC
jgi:uncharacterized membrane protein YhdT